MKTKGLFQPLVLAGILATGFLVVWCMLSIWAVEIGDHVAGTARRAEHLVFLPDGTPRVAYVAGRHGERAYHDLQGHAALAPENDNAGVLAGCRLPAALSDRAAAGETPWNQRIRSFSDGGSPPIYWYFVSDGRPDGTGYFAGYDSKSHVCVGYLGTSGFRPEPPAPEERIPYGGATWGAEARVYSTQGDHHPTEHPEERPGGRAPRGSVSTWDVYLLGRDEKIYHADLQRRTLHVALAERGIRSAALVAGPADLIHGTPHRLAVRTGDAVLVLDEVGQVLHRYPIPPPLRGRDITFTETTSGEAVVMWNSPFDELATEVEYRIDWVAPEGRYREARVALAWDGGMRSMEVFGGVVVPAPLVLDGLVGIVRPQDLVAKGLEATYPAALRRALTEFGSALLIAHLLAATLAVLCYRRQVQYGGSGAERLLWPLFVLVLGLPGWVAYRFGRSWPVLETCAACGAGVPRDREGCVRCQADFPRPLLKGTEVFA
jgi:hypothetical protein